MSVKWSNTVRFANWPRKASKRQRTSRYTCLQGGHGKVWVWTLWVSSRRLIKRINKFWSWWIICQGCRFYSTDGCSNFGWDSVLAPRGTRGYLHESGAQFKLDLIRELCFLWDVPHTHTTHYHSLFSSLMLGCSFSSSIRGLIESLVTTPKPQKNKICYFHGW